MTLACSICSLALLALSDQLSRESGDLGASILIYKDLVNDHFDFLAACI
jgi:hypothetical protein